jgi:hypothetical protein
MPAGVSAYVPLANVTLGSNTSNVTFSSINQTYRDLIFVLQASCTGSSAAGFQINSDGSNNYFMMGIAGWSGDFRTDAYNSQPRVSLTNGTSMSTTVWTNIIQFSDYSTSGSHKGGFYRANNTSDRTIASSFRWGSTSAITTVTFQGNNFPFAAGSTFALYGISSS